MRPVYPQPGYSEADVVALIASRTFVYADCFTIILNGGVDKLRYTMAQQRVGVVPLDDPLRVIFSANKVQISGLRFQIGVGVEVDEQTVALAYNETDMVQGQPFALALKLGWFDGAIIRRDRFFASEWRSGETTQWVGGTPIFVGRISSLDSVGRLEAKIKVKSELVLLNVDAPRITWQPGCVNTLYDLNCGRDPNLFNTTVTLAIDASVSVLPWASASLDYVLGKVYIENFDSVTRVRSILSVQPGVSITLSYPLDFVPTAGNQFVAYQGCDRTKARCPHFDTVAGDWVDRFRAYPYVPTAETAV